MASDVHVPYCEDETCLNHLRNLIKTLQQHGYTVSKNLIVGNYEQILKEKIENSCCTVLHKCETFWDKLHFFKLHEYILAQKAKFIVVRFESIYPAPKKQSNNDNAYEQFFKEFYVLPVTNEDNINDFLKGIQQSFPESMDVQETVTENTDIEARNITEIVSTDSDSSALYYASFFKRIEELRLKEKQQSSNKGQKLERFPEAHGNKLNDAWIFARVENQAQLSNHILDFSSLTNFKELKEKVNKIQRHPEKHIANLYFLLHIVLPDMHSSNDALGITYLAVSCPNIQRRAFLYLEDLIFKGRLAKNMDLDTLTVIQELFFNSITEIKQQRSINSVESSVEKLLNIIIEVQIEKIFLCHSSEDFDKLDLANKEMRKYLPKCKGWPNVDKLIKVLETILDSPGDKIQQEVRHILSKKQSDEYPYINVANFLGKKLSVIFAVVQSLLKKLFMNMNEKVLKFFKDCLHPKFGRKSLLLDSTVSDFLFKGLIHFLAHGLRESTHRNIENICRNVMAVINLLSTQETRKIERDLQHLIFASTPVIRKSIIKMLDEKNRYKNELQLFIVREAEHLLVPFLTIDPEEKKSMEFLVYSSKNQNWRLPQELDDILRQCLNSIKFCHDSHIVHANITADSFYVNIGTSKHIIIKLGGFKIAAKLGQSLEKVLDKSDAEQLIPLRWSPPETIFERKVSYNSDVYMIGILFVEIKTHGVLPYSVECADDEIFIEKLRENDLSTSQESCIDDSSNALIRKCTQKNPDERASLAEIISEHSRILLEGENNATARVSFPDLNDEKYMPSLGYKKGTLQLKNYVKPFQIELLKEMSNNMWLFTMNKNVFVRQKMNHRISSCTLKTIKSDSMRKILPQVYVFVITDGKDEFIDIHLPSSCKHSLDDLLEKKDIDVSISAYVEIVEEVANMLKTIHDNACVIGVLEVSNIFISQSRDGIMVHPVSLAYFSAIPNGGVASTMFDVLYDDSNSSERYAPEVTESKRFTKESDIYSLGQFCFQLYHRCTEIAKKEQTQNWIDNTNVTRSVSSLIDLPKILVDLFQNCILCDPTKRPKINYFIGCLKLLKQQMSDLQHKSNCVLHESILNASEPSTSAIYSETSVYVKENFIDPTILNPSEIDFSNHDYESTAHNETRHSIIFANESFLADSVLNPFEYEKVMQASLERVNPYNLLFEQSDGNHSLTEQVYDGINYVEPYGSVSNIYEVPILKKSFSGVLKNIKKAAQSFVKKKLKKNSKVNGRSNLYANVEDNYDVPQNARRSLPPPPIESDSENYIEIPSNTSITEDYPVPNDYLFQTYFSSSDKQDSFSQDDSLSQV